MLVANCNPDRWRGLSGLGRHPTAFRLRVCWGLGVRLRLLLGVFGFWVFLATLVVVSRTEAFPALGGCRGACGCPGQVTAAAAIRASGFRCGAFPCVVGPSAGWARRRWSLGPVWAASLLPFLPVGRYRACLGTGATYGGRGASGGLISFAKGA